jgi:hypothetical protein
MIEIVIGFILGFSFAFALRLIVINRRERKGAHEVKYNPLRISSKMKLMLREIVFKFSVQKFNRDFLLNIKSQRTTIIQLMHRSHFPSLLKNIADVQFGIAIYIPLTPLTDDQKQRLFHVLKEEMQNFNKSEYPIEFFVIDAGTRVRHTGYLLARIVREVFNKEDVDFELFDEGVLPYLYELRMSNGGASLN